MTENTNPVALILNLAGTQLPLWATEAKRKEGESTTRVYFTHRLHDKGFNRYGLSYQPFADALPTSVVLDGITIALTHEVRTSYVDSKTKQTVQIPEHEQRRGAYAKTTTTLPSIGEERQVKVTVTITKEGLWNVTANVTRVHKPVATEAEKAAQRTKAVTTRAANNMAALNAAMALLGRA